MTPRPAFALGGEEIDAGTRRTIDIPVSQHSDHTLVTMSAHVVHGRRDGPVVFVCSGIHGDEITGVEVLRRLLKVPNLRTLKGTLIVVPIVNAFGFINRSRYLPDRRDLNRSFPGSKSGSLAARLANVFMTEVVARSELGIDLHSAAQHRSNLPQIRITPGNKSMLSLARVFAAPAIVPSQIRDGSLRLAAKERGCDVLLYEAGEALRFDEFSTRVGVMGILRVLRELQMVTAKGISGPKVSPLYCSSSTWLRAPAGGLLRTYKTNGDVVACGDVLAEVSDPFGQEEWAARAPFDGLVIGRAVLPVVNEGDAIYHVATVRSAEQAEATLEGIASHLDDHPIFEDDEDIL